MQQHFPTFTVTPRGITMDGALLTKSVTQNLPLQTQRYVKRAEELFAKVKPEDWDNRTPHATNDVPVLAQAMMVAALASPQPYPPSANKHGVDALAKDAGDGDDEDDDSDSDDSGDDSDGNSDDDSGNGRYNPNEPRVPAGYRDGGQWTNGDNYGPPSTASNRNEETTGETATSGYYPGTLSVDDIRSALNGEDNSSSPNSPFYMSPENFMNGIPVYAVLSDGSSVQNPYTGGDLIMPANVSLSDNVSFGEKIAALPSIMTDNDPFDLPNISQPMVTPDIEAGPTITPAKEAAMILQFAPGQQMDYQRVYPTLLGSPNPLYVDFGNYNYGAVAAAAGYTLDQALYAAALVNARNRGNPNVDTSGPNGSNPRNNYFIQTGYNDYESGKIVASGN